MPIRRTATLLLPLLLATACAHSPSNDTGDAARPWADAGQMVLVTTADWDANQGVAARYERDTDAAAWRQIAAFPVSIGRHGSAWGSGLHPATDVDAGPVKREGDGRSPAGVFALGTAFGYAGQASTGLPYAQMQSDSWCMDVPDSPLYNRIVDAREVGQAAAAGSTEPMRLDLHRQGDPRYRLGLVIEHNADSVPRAGSCIFAHLWRTPGEVTAGCTAMADADMEALLAWLDADQSPRFVLLPQAQRQRLATAWNLPTAHGDAP